MRSAAASAAASRDRTGLTDAPAGDVKAMPFGFRYSGGPIDCQTGGRAVLDALRDGDLDGETPFQDTSPAL